MLPKQLQEIQDHLLSETKLSNTQSKLLAELEFLDSNPAIQNEIEDNFALLLESFSMAKTFCPNCGKKY
jgi:hypothetical protein